MDKQVSTSRLILSGPAQILLQGFDGEEQQFIFSTSIYKSAKEVNCELLKPWIIYRGVVGLGHRVRNEREGTGPPAW